ncbi:hypothetical protein JAAARDRAFT_184453 [Jaapia argillacea MUCL 33604]|uniref:Protein kinase domain-containing protein n=1 Tax=Jaapia argillacea MUCL 33604 TaxID=933084 RepID=A0A067PPN0_9AGAM|nr:hypothetical protein JAAARDRAFT_184453 [Jaapia argillacea MUCL 33604]
MLCHEVLIWRGLWHRYVLPCLGVNTEYFESAYISMVSPYMGRGTVQQYCLKNDLTADEINLILSQVASGLAYLHGENIVHGDLQGANILMDDRGHCQLADFGLAVFAEATQGVYTTRSQIAGSTRWMVPELLFSERFSTDGMWRRTCATDIYAYGCVCIEFHTGLPPFYDLKIDLAILFRILSGVHPQPPPGKELPPKIWDVAEKCWLTEPDTRPTAKNITEECYLIVQPVLIQESSGLTFIADTLESDLSTDQDNTSGGKQVGPSHDGQDFSGEHNQEA